MLSYINKSSDHPPQIINQLPKIINKRLSRNSTKEEVFSSSKYQYEKPLETVDTPIKNQSLIKPVKTEIGSVTSFDLKVH